MSEGLLLAYRGQLAAARASGIAQIRECTARGQRKLAEFGEYIVAVADLCAGDYDAAEAAALTVIEDDTPCTAEWALPELIEAATRAGHRDVAGSAFATMSERALAAGTPWALGLRARCAALIDAGEHSEEHYREAVSQLQQSRAMVDLARAHLLFGQWLRRARRRRDARRELRTARDMFTAMGADGFAEQAATELRATGERARARSPETAFDLTAARSRGRRPRRRGRLEQRDRRAAVHQLEDGGIPPRQRVQEARHHLANPARAPPPGQCLTSPAVLRTQRNARALRPRLLRGAGGRTSVQDCVRRGGLPMPAAVAVPVMLAWAVIPAVAGAWRTRTQDA